MTFVNIYSKLTPMFAACVATAIGLGGVQQLGSQDEMEKSQVIRVPSAVVKVSESVKVPAEYAGVLTDVRVKEGQLLKVGDLIGKINDAELRLRLERAQQEKRIAMLTAENDVDIRFAAKSTEVAQSEVSRSMRSNSRVKNSIPKSQFERQVLERDRAVLQHEKAKRDFAIGKLKTNLAQNEIELSKLLLQKTEIRSPVNGMVVSVERRQGEWVEPSETVVRIVQVDRLRIEGFVSAKNVGQIKIGSSVDVNFSQPWLRDRKYKGKVVFVSPEANPVNSQILIWCEIGNEQNDLVPGLRGEIVIGNSPLKLGKR